MKDQTIHRFSPGDMLPGESHGGVGVLLAVRALASRPGSAIRHVDQVILRPGATIGAHRHARDNEEIYVIVAGGGTMLIEETGRQVVPGDVVVNPPGGRHGFVNSMNQDAWLVVIEVDHGQPARPVNRAAR